MYFRPSVCLSVCISAAQTGWIFVKFGIEKFGGKLSRKSKFVSNRSKLSGILHEDIIMFRYALWQNCGKLLLASSCLSFCPPPQNNSAPTRRIFMKFDIWVFFRKSVKKIQVSLKSDNNKGHFTCSSRPIYIFDHILLSSLNEKYFRPKLYRKSKHILCSITFFFPESCRLWDNVDIYCTAGQTTDDNKAHEHCMLDN